jgi:hypothetical protein
LTIQSTAEFNSVFPYPASLGSVCVHTRKASEYLPKGAQGQLIDAAILAEEMGTPINRLTTIRTEILARSSSGIFAGRHEADAIRILLELMRKWHIERGVPWVCIWSREVGDDVGGHVHSGTHQSEETTEDFIEQVASWTGEPRILLKNRKRANIGISEHGSWLVQCCTRRDQSGADLAAYLGKDEPNHIVSAWGVSRDNKSKRVLHHACKGGYLEGTTGKSGKSYRHGTSRNIAPSASRSTLEAISDARRLIRPDLSWLPY